MTDLRTAAQQALEALMDDCLVKVGPHSWERRSDLAITALRAALAEPVQEPVAWLFTNLQSGDYDFCYQEDEHDHDREMWHKQPLYTAPPQRKPLTYGEISKILSAYETNYDMIGFARAIEKAHDI